MFRLPNRHISNSDAFKEIVMNHASFNAATGAHAHHKHFSHFCTCKVYGTINTFKNSLKIDDISSCLVIQVSKPTNDSLTLVRVSMPDPSYVRRYEQNFKLSKNCWFLLIWHFASSNIKPLYLPNYMSYNSQIWHGNRASQYLQRLTGASF